MVTRFGFDQLGFAEVGRSGLVHEIHGGIHLVGGGSLLPHLPILAQNILGRPRVVIGRVQGIQGLPQVTGNPLYTNALGAVKAHARELLEGSAKSPRHGGIKGFIEKLF